MPSCLAWGERSTISSKLVKNNALGLCHNIPCFSHPFIFNHLCWTPVSRVAVRQLGAIILILQPTEPNRRGRHFYLECVPRRKNAATSNELLFIWDSFQSAMKKKNRTWFHVVATLERLQSVEETFILNFCVGFHCDVCDVRSAAMGRSIRWVDAKLLRLSKAG